MSGIDELYRKNAEYAQRFKDEGLASAPSMKVAVVACMDARLEMGPLLGIGAGDVHVIRNAGGVVTDDVIRSLMVSQRKLGTREILIIQHTGCGMHGLDEGAFVEEITKEAGEKPGFAIGAFTDLDDSVRRSMEKIRACKLIPHRDHVRGFVYEIKTGRLREVE